jgi:hypothetical protein
MCPSFRSCERVQADAPRQDGHPNHDHGAHLCHCVFHLHLLAQCCFRHRCCPGCLRSAFTSSYRSSCVLDSDQPQQAFVIYCFFELLLGYLGGERSLLILVHGRPPKDPVFPITLFRSEIDVSDPYTFLFLKRGILRE